MHPSWEEGGGDSYTGGIDSSPLTHPYAPPYLSPCMPPRVRQSQGRSQDLA